MSFLELTNDLFFPNGLMRMAPLLPSPYGISLPLIVNHVSLRKGQCELMSMGNLVLWNPLGQLDKRSCWGVSCFITPGLYKILSAASMDIGKTLERSADRGRGYSPSSKILKYY